jgi:hypothetical protein
MLSFSSRFYELLCLKHSLSLTLYCPVVFKYTFWFGIEESDVSSEGRINNDNFPGLI